MAMDSDWQVSVGTHMRNWVLPYIILYISLSGNIITYFLKQQYMPFIFFPKRIIGDINDAQASKMNNQSIMYVVIHDKVGNHPMF